jgi:hypothetical protein
MSNTIKNIGTIVIAVVVIYLVFLLPYIAGKKRVNEITIEKEVIDLKKQDSLLNVISTLEDSLSKKKIERIKQIDTVYEKTIDSIRTLNPTQQVELLTRNLSQTSRD